jgi:hypothetical protein
MRNRTRRRWLRRLAVGISFATFVAPAAARPDEGGAAASSWGSPLKTLAVAQALGAPQAGIRPDDRADRFTGVQQTELVSNAVRPDDRADRFALSDGSPASSRLDAGVSWDGALTLGIGSLVLVLALGLGIGYIRRPRIAGL